MMIHMRMNYLVLQPDHNSTMKDCFSLIPVSLASLSWEERKKQIKVPYSLTQAFEGPKARGRQEVSSEKQA